MPQTAVLDVPETRSADISNLLAGLNTLTLRQTDNENIRRVIEMVGRRAFAELFEVRIEIKPKTGFAQRQHELPARVRETREMPAIKTGPPIVSMLRQRAIAACERVGKLQSICQPYERDT